MDTNPKTHQKGHITTSVVDQTAQDEMRLLAPTANSYVHHLPPCCTPCCTQELMQAAILASTQPLAAALRTVLHGLHSEKRVAGVDALLLRLYRPILFRAFTANNAAVRLNALHLLLDAFPLMVGWGV